MEGLFGKRLPMNRSSTPVWFAAVFIGLAMWTCSDWCVFLRDIFGLPVRFNCEPVEGEYGDYRTAMCEFVVQHQIRTVDPMENEIMAVEEITMDGRHIVIVKLHCCGLGGDFAYIDVDTGEVIDYTEGPNVY